MLKNYLTVAFRNILRHKVYSVINIAGLAVGMACTVLILMWVQHEFSFDHYHENVDKIYRLASNWDLGKWQGLYAISNHAVGPTMQKDYPEIVNACRFRPIRSGAVTQYKNKKFREEEIFYADNSVFDIFSFPMVNGDPKSALDTAHSVVITEDIAQKYFGSENPVGKTLKMTFQDRDVFGNSYVASNAELDATVTGVIKNVPRNSHFTFNMLLSFETLYHYNEKQRGRWWGDLGIYTYILIREGCDFKELKNKFPALIEKHIGEDLKTGIGKFEFVLEPLKDIHLYSDAKWDISRYGSIAYVYTFSTIALFILLIACINFMNLSTARSANRAREVGVRKAVGAHRGNLINQFFGESFLFGFISLLIALGLVEIFLPVFRSLSGREFTYNNLIGSQLFPALIGLVLFVGLIAGSYPALFLSAFQPMRIFTGHLKASTANSRFRSVLVVTQFTISIALIVGTVIIFYQLNYMKYKDLGFGKEHIAVLRILDDTMRRSIDSVKRELLNHSGIAGVTVSSAPPGYGARTNVFLPEGFGLNQVQMMGSISIDSDFIPTIGLEIVAGRNFSSEISADRSKSILINQTAARQFGWNDPIGKSIQELDHWNTTKTIVGVVRDFHIESLHNKISPLLIESEPSRYRFILIKIWPESLPEKLSFIKEKWKEIDPTATFDYWFLDESESFSWHYQSEQRLSKIFSYFALLAIFIACLGLFGLANFTAEQRTKEIGIRKAMGASISSIIMLLLKQFAKWVLIANIIAWPIAYFAMNRWLQNFAYRINIGLSAFILAGLIILVIASLTVSYQAIKAARGNPVDALRYE
jgi:putative ABC transport system permease protein